MDSKEILEAYGFVTPKGSVATTAEQAAGIAEQLGYPVVLKIWSPDILHKSDVGGVRIGLKDATAVKDAFDLMMYRVPKAKPDADILGVLVQQMCSRGKEVILGMNRDPHYGPLMMFGEQVPLRYRVVDPRTGEVLSEGTRTSGDEWIPDEGGGPRVYICCDEG